MYRLIYTDEDGVLCVVLPEKKERIELVMGPMTDEEYRQHVIDRSIPPGHTHRVIEVSVLPPDRLFRNAWEDSQPGNQIDICCQKAKEIALVNLRYARDKKLEFLDRKFMIAFERGTDLEVIKTRKQDLRDITEPLKAVTVTGKFNDATVLRQLKKLSSL